MLGTQGCLTEGAGAWASPCWGRGQSTEFPYDLLMKLRMLNVILFFLTSKLWVAGLSCFSTVRCACEEAPRRAALRVAWPAFLLADEDPWGSITAVALPLVFLFYDRVLIWGPQFSYLSLLFLAAFVPVPDLGT